MAIFGKRFSSAATPIQRLFADNTWAGGALRTITLPVRLAAPVVQLGARALRGNRWVEHVAETDEPVPELRLPDRERVQLPQDGAGPLNHRTYKVRIADCDVTPEQLMEMFRADPNSFCPTSYAVFSPDPAPEGLTAGTDFVVKLPGPWDGPVLVQEVEPKRIRLATRIGHMEAGFIEFGADQNDDVTIFTIESFARSGDAVFDALYHEVGIAKLVQTQMWVSVLESAVEASGGRQQGRITVETTVYPQADK